MKGLLELCKFLWQWCDSHSVV